jgi:DNA-binding phage protein
MTDKSFDKFRSVMIMCADDFIYPMFEAVLVDNDKETVEATMAALGNGLAILGRELGLSKDELVLAFSRTIDVVYEQDLEEEELH